jgi:hypothetical protein
MTVTPSTTLLTDLETVISTPPTTATKTKAKTSAGGDIDYVGMCSAALAALAQAKETLIEITAATDSADPNLATLANILASLS